MHNTNRELDGSRFYTETESNSFNFETNNKMQVSAGRDIFHRVSKSDLEWLFFTFLHPVIGPKNSRYHLNQSDAKLKPITTWSLAFSRASGTLPVFTLSSHWLMMMLTFVLIGSCD